MKIPKSLIRYLLIVGVAAGAVASASGKEPLKLPPLVKYFQNEYHHGKFVWGDLFTAEPEAAIDFYTRLFRWTTETYGEGDNTYTILFNGDHPIAGVVQRDAPADAPVRARWLGYVSVSNISEAVKKAEYLGGKVLVSSREMPDRGELAIVADPEGTPIGLLHSTYGDPADHEAAEGDWVWVQLYAREPQAAAAFYEAVTGLTPAGDDRTAEPNDYVLSSEGEVRAGLMAIPEDTTERGGWLGFVRTDDVVGTLNEAVALGAQVLVPPNPQDGNSIAVLIDPLGGAIGLYAPMASEEVAP